MNKKLLFIIFLSSLNYGFIAQAQEKTLHLISNSHLDTQWNWDVKTTIDQYIYNTMVQNFSLLDKYTEFKFNFEAAIHYMWMKEYYPTEYTRLKGYIEGSQWNVSGGSINANDVMVPSAESSIRNFLYGQVFYKKEFGIKGGHDIMLPDCFGFPYSLPTLGKHCGVTGFHTAKLSWGSAYKYEDLPPFAVWKGVDGSEVYAVLKPGAYDTHEVFNKNLAADDEMLNTINSNYSQYGLPGTIRYVGPRSDRGGGLQDNSNQTGENTPYWLQTSVKANGPVTVKMSTPDQVFDYLAQYRNDKYPVLDTELPMSTHGVGCYTSQAVMKYWNRKNELLADATEKSSVMSDWLGGVSYPSDVLTNSWIRILWHQFHDDLTGTSIPNAYNYSYNDEVLVNLELSKTLINSVGAVAKGMNTQVLGIPLVVYNPLSIERSDIVEASLIVSRQPVGIRVLDADGNDVLAQLLDYDTKTGKASFIFHAKVLSLGYAVYDVRFDENKAFESSLIVTNGTLENDLYRVTLNSKGDVSSIYDKEQALELLNNPIRLGMFYNKSTTFPSWEIWWNYVNANPISYVDENVNVSIAEEGPLRVSLKVTRSKKGSDFVQYIRLTNSDISGRIDFVNEVNWQTRETMLKAIFPLSAPNPKVTYDLSIGAIERGVNNSQLYEVAGHQWADQTQRANKYGVSILNDCKYGWDKPDNSILRLTLLHTPEVENNYAYQKDQDLGLNKFTFSFFRHLGSWSEDTQWEASKLNQPLLAFQAPKHDGELGKSVYLAQVNSDKVAIKALKKSEEVDDEFIVRVYELTGTDQSDVKISFPANIISAREVNGIEEEVGAVAFDANSLSFDIGRFQPKTFAVKLSSYSNSIQMEKPSSKIVDLVYNIDLMSYNTRKYNATAGVKYAYPAELLPNDTISIDGIDFKIGSRKDRQNNAMLCSGQTITLSGGNDTKKVYLLMASGNEKGVTADFIVDGKKHTFNVPYYAGNVGVWETEYNLGREYREENVAFTATHRHNVANDKDDAYNFLYIYKYTVSVDNAPSTLTLPNNKDIYLFAVSLSNNENDDVSPATAITSLPEYNDLLVNQEECGTNLVPTSVSASHQNGQNEGPDKAIDGDVNTKWCVTNNDTPWLEMSFDEPVEICRWFVMNAGTEGLNVVTKDFRLQRYDNGGWVDVDVVKNNKINKINRSVEPFVAERIRLQIDKAEQNGTTTRILEFAVFGKNNTSSIENPEWSSEADKLLIIGNFPNPVKDVTTIRCVLPENADNVIMQVYTLSGNLLEEISHPIDIQKSVLEFDWDAKSLANGIYLYKLSVYENMRLIDSASNKLIINK